MAVGSQDGAFAFPGCFQNLPAGISGGVAGMGWIGPRRNRREVAGPAAGPMGPMPDRTPNLQPAAQCSSSRRDFEAGAKMM